MLRGLLEHFGVVDGGGSRHHLPAGLTVEKGEKRRRVEDDHSGSAASSAAASRRRSATSSSLRLTSPAARWN
jgi:hypothetical protein